LGALLRQPVSRDHVLMEALHPEDRERLEAAIAQATHTLPRNQFPGSQVTIEAELLRHGYWEGELIHWRRDGTPVVASRWVLQQDAQGRPIKVLEINNDITQRKRHEESQARMASIIESSDDGILSTTLDGRIIALCKLIQYRNGRCSAPPIPVLNQLAQGSISRRKQAEEQLRL